MTRLEAKAHWYAHVADWTVWGEQFKERIFAIEDPLLRYAVAAVTDSVASGCGSVAIRRVSPTQVGVAGFYLDVDVEEAIKANLLSDGAEDPIRIVIAADLWLRNQFDRASLLQVAWSFGHFENAMIDPNAKFRWLEHHDIIYDVPTNRFLGVRYSGGIWKVR